MVRVIINLNVGNRRLNRTTIKIFQRFERIFFAFNIRIFFTFDIRIVAFVCLLQYIKERMNFILYQLGYPASLGIFIVCSVSLFLCLYVSPLYLSIFQFRPSISLSLPSIFQFLSSISLSLPSISVSLPPPLPLSLSR